MIGARLGMTMSPGKWCLVLASMGSSLLMPHASASEHEEQMFCTAEWEGPNRPDPLDRIPIVNRVRLSQVVVRRDLSLLGGVANDDLGLFSEAVGLMKQKDGDPDTLLQGREGRSPTLDAYEALRAVHGHDAGSKRPWSQCVHGVSANRVRQPLFLLWHRAFVRAAEISANSLIAEQRASRGESFPGFGIPYWNWSDDRSLPRAFRCPRSRQDLECEQLEDVARACSEKHDRGYPNPLFSSCRNPTARTQADIWVPPAGSDPFTPLTSDYWTMDSRLESGWHQAIHDDVAKSATQSANGWMAWPAFAVLDPVFWPHHSNIDRMMIGWITALQATGSDDPRTDLLDQTRAGSELQQAWDEEQARFPVYCGGRIVWYQPHYREVAPLLDDDGDLAARLGYRYDSVRLPDARSIPPVDVRQLLSKVRSSVLVRPSRRQHAGPELMHAAHGSAERSIDANGTRFRIRVQDLTAATGWSRVSAAALQSDRHPKLRQAIILGLSGLTAEQPEAAGVRHVVAIRFCASERRCSDAAWQFNRHIGSFGIPVGHRGHGSHADAIVAVDLSEAVFQWLSQRPPVVADVAMLELAIVPTRIGADGRFLPAASKAGLSLRSITLH